MAGAGGNGPALSTNFVLIGDRELIEAMGRLTVSIRNKILGPILREAGRTLAVAIAPPVETGLLKASIGFGKLRTYTDTVYVAVGPRRGFRKATRVNALGRRVAYGKNLPPDIKGPNIRNPVHYAHLVERGTKFAAAQPFMAPAFESVGPSILATAEAQLRAAIQQQAQTILR